MRAILWILVVLNVGMSGFAFLFSMTSPAAVKDVLQIIGGGSLLTTVGLLYLALHKAESSGNR